LEQLSRILKDPEASPNDRFVALDLLKNANIAAGGVLPMCQDTGTAIVLGKKGQLVFTGGGDEAAIARGVFDTYRTANLRYSQLAPLDTYREKNTGNNLPAQIELFAVDGDAYKFLFMAKGGGSANKSYLYQETKALLNPESLLRFVDQKIRTLGTAACPPYHLAIVIGGTSAEYALKVAKLASARYLDQLPASGNELGHGFRERARGSGLGHSAAYRDRRAVRRQVFLSRRARRALAASRRELPRRDRGLVLGGSPGGRQDHEARRVPGGAGARSGQIPAGNDARRSSG
jgi:fumarate hydratase class I